MKKLYLTISILLLAISFFAFPVSASSYYDDNGYLTFINSDPPSNFVYDPLSVPVLNSGTSIPSDKQLVMFSVTFDSSTSSTGVAEWVYADPSVIPFTFYQNGGNIFCSGLNHAFYVRNYITLDGQLSFRNTGTMSGISSVRRGKYTLFVPVLDSNGDIIEPNFDSDLVEFSIVGCSDGVELNISPRSGSLGTPYDVYLFPSSLPVNSGIVNEYITSPTYISEIPASDMLRLREGGFADLIDQLQQNYNDYYSQYENGAWYQRGLPTIHFFAECQDEYVNTRFNPSSYDLPYAKLLSFSRNSKLWLKRSDFVGGSRVYSYDHLCIVVVAHGEENDTISRYDFTPALLSDSSVNPPSTITDTTPFIGSTVDDFNDLGAYLRYLFQKQSDDRAIQDSNIIANIQSIPWSNFIAGGTYRSLSNFLPSLSDSLDYTFGNLFSDWFIPSAEQMEELEDELEDDREEFQSKFAFIGDLKDEVSFIFETIMRSGDAPRQFKANLNGAYGVGEVTFFDTDQIPSTVLTAAKNLITVFLTLALVLHIWRTLPSTIGKMPSGGD